MVLLSSTKFLQEVRQMYRIEKPVTVRMKQIVSKRVGKEFRQAAMDAGETVLLVRAYCGNNGHKKKISVAITAENHSLFFTLFNDLMKSELQGLEKTKKGKKLK